MQTCSSTAVLFTFFVIAWYDLLLPVLTNEATDNIQCDQKHTVFKYFYL